MNSHVSPINLQSPGQTVVVSHHRGFSQPSSANTGDPWFLQSSHQMAPTAPARHKRPAPQPGSITQQQQQQQQSHILPPIPQTQLPSHPANTVIRASYHNNEAVNQFVFFTEHQSITFIHTRTQQCNANLSEC